MSSIAFEEGTAALHEVLEDPAYEPEPPINEWVKKAVDHPEEYDFSGLTLLENARLTMPSEMHKFLKLRASSRGLNGTDGISHRVLRNIVDYCLADEVCVLNIHKLAKVEHNRVEENFSQKSSKGVAIREKYRRNLKRGIPKPTRKYNVVPKGRKRGTLQLRESQMDELRSNFPNLFISAILFAIMQHAWNEGLVPTVCRLSEPRPQQIVSSQLIDSLKSKVSQTEEFDTNAAILKIVATEYVRQPFDLEMS